MHLIVVGLSHRATALDVRERLAFGPSQIPEALTRLREAHGVSDAVILSTCNRVELYAAAPDLGGTVERVTRFLSDHGRLPEERLREQLYSFTEPESVRHLFSVASGLDSMVLGEAEILRQVKDAYALAVQSGTSGKLVHALFQRALNAAKTVRERTGLGEGGVSVGSVAVELAGKIFRQICGTTVLVVGAGKMGALTLARLLQRGAREVRVMNRSFERAAALAGAHRVLAVPWEQFAAQLLEVDLLITSTAAPGYLLDRATLGRAMRSRRQRPLCIVDLGVPRNVDPSAGRVENVYLFDMDSLQEAVARATRTREQAVEESLKIIERKVGLFVSWWQTECGDGSSRHWHAGQPVGAGASDDHPGTVGAAAARPAH